MKASAGGDEIIFSWPLIKKKRVSLRESECANEVEVDDCNQYCRAIKTNASDTG